MNKKTLLIIIILIAAPVGYLLLNNQALENSVDENDAMELPVDSAMEGTDSMDSMEKEDSAMEKMVEAPEGAIVYELSEGSTASYVAQKRFLEKEDDEVVGTTSNVSGEGWIQPETQEMYLNASVDLSLLSTNSEQRDEDVQKMFTETLATVTLNGVDDEISLGVPFSTTADATVVINGVTREVQFTVEGTVTESEFNAQGQTTVNISDFGIEPPSLISVFTVDDEIELRFDVTGQAIAQ